ncbi:MAG: putative tonB-linked outer rane receptor [Bacteroidota bacterium]|nr:putative tonB-linked outer rane receptor [Bacteroidota bacterium]
MIKKATVKSYFIAPFFMLSFQLYGEEHIIKGNVIDSKKNQPLGYCNVSVMNTSIGTQTNEQGNFKIVLPENLQQSKLIFSFMGYKADTLQVDTSITECHIILKDIHTNLDEIIITAFSHASEVSENPSDIKMVSQKKLEQSNETNIIESLSKNVAGLNSLKTGPNVSKPYIRGLGYNRVMVLYDGVPQEGQQFEDEEVLAVDMYAVESAEVILGPSSLRYGPEALAGTINIIPSVPTDTDKKIHGKFVSEYQSNNGLTGNGLQLNYGSQHWTAVARGSFRIAKNFSNKIDGKVYNTGFREINASASLIYKRSNGYSDLNFTIYDNKQGIPDGSRDSLTRKFTKPVFDDPQDDLLTRPIVSDAELNSYALSPIYQHIMHFRAYSKSEYNFNNGSRINAIISFQQNQRKEHDFPIQKDLLGVSMYLNSYCYDVLYQYKKIHNITFSTGINGAFQTNKNKDAHDIPIPDYKLFDGGIYSLAKWNQKKWTVTGGVRFDGRFIKGNNFYTREDSTTELLSRVYVPDTANAELLFPAFKKTYLGISSNIGATYKASENIILKLNLAQGFRPPHVSEFASNGLDGSAHSYFIGKGDLKSEFNWQVDFGAIFNYKDVNASLTVFNNYIKNYIYLVQLVDNNGNPIELIPDNKTFQYQQSNADLVGMECMVDVHPEAVKGFSVLNNFSMVYGFNKDAKYKNKGIDGEYLPSIPPIRLLTTLRQEIKINTKILPKISLKVESDFSAAQKRYLSLNNTETATSAYILLNAGINFTFQYSKRLPLQLQFEVSNLLNKAYQSNLNRLKYFEYYSESPTGYTGIYSMGRNFTLKLLLPF